MASHHQASPQSGMMAHHRVPPGPMQQPNGAPPQYRPAVAPPPPGAQQPANPVDRLTALNELTWIQVGRAAEQIGNNEIAVFSYERAIRFNQHSLEALHSIAAVLRSEDKYDQAIQYIRTILQLDQHNGESWSALGHCYLMMDELQDAYQAYQSALYNLRDPKEPKLWYGIGILYDRYGSLDHAEEAFSQVMRMAPEFDKATEIYFRLGIIYKQQGKFDQSLECFRWIADKPPAPLNRTDIWFQIGHVYEQQKDFTAAKDAYRRVLGHDPKHAKVLQQLGWLHHQESSDYHSQEQAIEYLEQSVNSDQTDAQSWYLLGRCYMSQQKFPKAYEAYQQAVYRDGRNPTFWCSIGVLYYQINQYRDALDAYSRAIRLNPNISEVWYDLGTLYESCNNQTGDALDAYQRAAELDPSNQHIKARLQYLRSGQGSGHPAQNGQPVDVHPQAYQPASVHGPPQPQWGAHGPPQAQLQQPAPPPVTGGREWNQRPEHIHGAPPIQAQQTNPYDSRDTPRGFQTPLHHQPSPRSGPEHLRQNENIRHTPMRRPPSPSPQMRNAVPGPYGASPALQHGVPPPGAPQAQPPPNRISNPNYGQPLPPAPSQGSLQQGQQGPLPPYRAASPPPEVKPIIENRPRSPRSAGFPQPSSQNATYQHHADPTGPSMIQSGHPAPLAALAAAEAAMRERNDRSTPNSATSKRVREWEERDETHNKKPASDENRARLEDPNMRRPTPPGQGSGETQERAEREHEGSRAPFGVPAAPAQPNSDASQRVEESQRAQENYMPSAVAHQPQPLNTVIQQETQQQQQQQQQQQHDAESVPNAAAAPSAAPDTAQSNALRNGEVSHDAATTEPSREKTDKDGDVRMRTEEPAARKIDVDEDYDDESAEDVKSKEKNGHQNGGTSTLGSRGGSPRTGVAGVVLGANGATAKAEA